MDVMPQAVVWLAVRSCSKALDMKVSNLAWNKEYVVVFVELRDVCDANEGGRANEIELFELVPMQTCWTACAAMSRDTSLGQTHSPIHCVA